MPKKNRRNTKKQVADQEEAGADTFGRELKLMAEIDECKKVSWIS